MPTHSISIVPFLRWAEKQDDVRAAILTSTRAIPGGQVDEFSDYDIILVVEDVHPYHASRAWLESFGPLLTLYRDPIMMEDCFATTGNITHYENGLKIDFTLWPVGMLQHVAAAERLPDEFDAGYRILLDKDGLTVGLKPPTYSAYIPAPPTDEQYHEQIEVFFNDAIYTAKYLRRGDIAAACYIQDAMMNQEHLIPMLVWLYEIEHGWQIKPGPHGRRIQKYLRPELHDDLLATYPTGSEADGWRCLDRAMALMRRAGCEVGAALGFVYPEDLHERVVAFINTQYRG